MNDIISKFKYEPGEDALSNYERFYEIALRGEKTLYKKIYVKPDNRKNGDEIAINLAKKELTIKIKQTTDSSREILIGKLKDLNKKLFNAQEKKRKEHINKVIKKIAVGDVNSKNFWDQLNKIGKKTILRPVT